MYILTLVVNLGAYNTGLTIHGQLYDDLGDPDGSPITSGIVEVSAGSYLYNLSVADDYIGVFSLYDSADPDVKAVWSINPNEYGNLDVAVSTRASQESIDALGNFTNTSQLLSFADLQYMRSVEVTAMSSEATIYRPTFSSGILGDTVETFSSVGTCFCDVWPISRNTREKSRDSQEISLGEFYISVPFSANVRLEDVLVISGVSYQITFIPKLMSWLTNLRLEAKNYNNELKIL